MEVYSCCGCYELRTAEEVNEWHHTHLPNKYNPDDTLVSTSKPKMEVQDISSDDEVIEISSDSDDIDAALACEEIMSDLSDETLQEPSSGLAPSPGN